MFRSLIACFLIGTILTANFSRYIIYASFELNRNYIASVLCENRDKPKLDCRGKCYLTKKIKQAEEKEKSREQQAQKNRFQEALVTERLTLHSPSVTGVLAVSFESSFNLPRHSSSIFHPPQV